MWDFLKQTHSWPHGSSSKSPSEELKKLLKKVVSFRDLHIHVNVASDASLTSLEAKAQQEEAHIPSSSSLYAAGQNNTHRVVLEQKKLAIILVGLPGRGKTFLCNKLKCYLNWLGHPTAHFNVGQYRRKIKEGADMQDAEFFDHNNPAGRAARERAFHLALQDMMGYLHTEAGQVAILDATNSTQERRNKVCEALRGRVRYIFIENICADPAVLQQNYLNKMLYSPDYQGVDTEQAVSDFMLRIRKYEDIYEPIEDRNMHYIKLTDMVTGRGHIDINRISGYLPGKIVFFLMQVCKSGMTNARRIWLTRHGESIYNQKALIGGDSSLSPNGAAYAEVLPEVILSRLPKSADGTPVPVSVWTSTLQRTIQTAAALPFAKLRWKALDEIDAGICDGMTYAQIAEKHPAEYEARKKDKLRYRYPQGESYLDMIARLEPVISEMEREGESIVIVGHQAVLRVIFGYLMAQPQAAIPSIHIPLHTVIELTPRPDGTMGVEYIPVPIQLGDGPHAHPSDLAASMEASMGEQQQLPPALLQQQCQLQAQLAAAVGCGAAAAAAAVGAPAGPAEDAAVVIGDGVLCNKVAEQQQQQRDGNRASSESTDSFVSAPAEMQRMSSCSSSSTIAQMAAAAAVAQMH
uniref:6-phosphofructo-2-kinase domain-containing protein n=1 Tax=Tetradesmus obliquus TaxID=3088 RepID=A0A383W1K9_TETOB|eukprot:jgi/Sobl393_1/10009/SZX71568.1